MLEDLQLRFTDNEISPWGGLTLLFKMLEKCNMKAALAACPLPKQGSNRGYSPEQLIYGLFAGVWCGASCFEQLEIVRHDRCIIHGPSDTNCSRNEVIRLRNDNFASQTILQIQEDKLCSQS